MDSQSYGSMARPYRDDPRQESSAGIQGILDEIRSDIYKINASVSQIDQKTKLIGSSVDNKELRQQIHEIEQRTNGTISQIMRSFKKLSSRHLDRPSMLQVNRIKQDFEDHITRYQQIQKKAANKARSIPLPKSGLDTSSELLVDIDQTDHERQQNELKRQQMQSQQLDIDTDLEYIRQRDDQIRKLESDVLDINEIFQDLATLVHEQQETIDDIERNVSSGLDNVTEGANQLRSAASYQRKARKKMCILILIVILVLGVLALIIWLSVKN